MSSRPFVRGVCIYPNGVHTACTMLHDDICIMMQQMLSRPYRYSHHTAMDDCAVHCYYDRKAKQANTFAGTLLKTFLTIKGKAFLFAYRPSTKTYINLWIKHETMGGTVGHFQFNSEDSENEDSSMEEEKEIQFGSSSSSSESESIPPKPVETVKEDAIPPPPPHVQPLAQRKSRRTRKRVKRYGYE